jgi:hypothetical protein
VQLGWNLGCVVYCKYSTCFTNNCVILFACVCVCVCVCVCEWIIISQKLLVSIRKQSFISTYVKLKNVLSFETVFFFVVCEWISYVIFVFADSISISIGISERCKETKFFCDSLNPRVVGLSPMLGTTLAGTVLACSRSYGLCLWNICGTLLGKDVSHTHTHTQRKKVFLVSLCFLSLSLSLTHTHTEEEGVSGFVVLSLSLSHTHTHTHVSLNLSRISTGHRVYLTF